MPKRHHSGFSIFINPHKEKKKAIVYVEKHVHVNIHLSHCWLGLKTSLKRKKESGGVELERIESTRPL